MSRSPSARSGRGGVGRATRPVVQRARPPGGSATLRRRPSPGRCHTDRPPPRSGPCRTPRRTSGRRAAVRHSSQPRSGVQAGPGSTPIRPWPDHVSCRVDSHPSRSAGRPRPASSMTRPRPAARGAGAGSSPGAWVHERRQSPAVDGAYCSALVTVSLRSAEAGAKVRFRWNFAGQSRIDNGHGKRPTVSGRTSPALRPGCGIGAGGDVVPAGQGVTRASQGSGPHDRRGAGRARTADGSVTARTWPTHTRPSRTTAPACHDGRYRAGPSDPGPTCPVG